MKRLSFGGVPTTFFSHIDPSSANGSRRIPESVRRLIANWNSDGSAEISCCPICAAHVEILKSGNFKATLYASGYYFGVSGLCAVFAMEVSEHGKRLRKWKRSGSALAEY